MDVDQDFLVQMGAETGLEHSLLINDKYTTSSFPVDPQDLAEIDRQQISDSPAEGVNFNQFDFSGRPYFAARQLLGNSGLEVEVALDVSDVASAQRRLFWILTGGIVTIAALGAAFGSILSRYISLPLVNLAEMRLPESVREICTPLL